MEASELRIRAARDPEAELLTALCLRSKAHQGYDDAFMARCRPALTLDPTYLLRHPTRVAEGPAGQLLGVAAYSLDLDSAPGQAEIELLFVEPAHLGQGIGRALLQHLMRELHALGCRKLWVLSDPKAEAFYLSQGATRVDLRPSDCIPGRELPWLCLELSPGA